jgi:hypothetical protein
MSKMPWPQNYVGRPPGVLFSDKRESNVAAVPQHAHLSKMGQNIKQNYFTVHGFQLD